MTNPNDNSELFEIFQNEMDLGQHQDDEEEEEEEEDVKEDDDSEEIESEETSEQQDQNEAPSRSETTAGASSRSQDTSNTSQPENDRSAGSGNPSTHGDEAPSSPDADSAAKQSPPSSAVAQEKGSDPDGETGSHIQDQQNEQELDGKIILSRGASVFSLLLVFIAMIGAYFIGLQTGSNQQADKNPDAVTLGGTQGGQNTTDQSGNTPETAQATNNTQSGDGGTSNNETSNSAIVAGQTYYTIGLIAYKSSKENLESYIDPVQRSLREDGGLKYVSTVQNPVGNRQVWIVVGYFKSRDVAKRKIAEIEDYLNRTDYRDDYTKDILEITSDQARKINADK